ncbi:MAG: lysophospholipid acyltransferase family protein [Verrucomicrobiota bacterium]
MSSRKRHEIRGDRKSALLGLLAGWTMKLIVATLRLEVRDHCGIGVAGGTVPPVIYILWHNRFFTVPAAWNRLCGSLRQSVTLTSASRDGDMVARAMAVFGLGAIRGSSSRRGVAALVGLMRALREGSDVCLTPDGPRGPRYQLQAGVIKLAQASGAAIVPVDVHFGSAWRLKTWDRFVIPKPFSRVVVTFGTAIALPRDLDEAAFETARRNLETLLVAGTDDA